MLGSSRKIKSLGKKTNDALIELSFVLPLPANAEGIKLAEHFVKQHRFNKVEKITAFSLNAVYTQFTVLAESSQVLKVPHEQKKSVRKNEVCEYDRIIAQAEKITHGEETSAPATSAPEAKPHRRFRPRRRRGRRSHQKPGAPRQEAAGEMKESTPAAAKPVEPQES